MQNNELVEREYQNITANLNCVTKRIRRYEKDHDADNLMEVFKKLDTMKEHIEKLQKEVVREYLEVRK